MIGAVGRFVPAMFVVATFVATVPPAAQAYPAAGSDFFNSSAQVFITPAPGCPFGPGTPLVVNEALQGPTLIDRADPVILATGKEQIPIEMLRMDLTGNTARIMEDPDRASTGTVTEQTAGQDFPADSILNVFVEVVLGAFPGVVFENLTPVVMQSVIYSLPPHAFPYLPPPGTCIPLAVEGTTTPVLWLIHAEHLPKTNRECAVATGIVRLRDLLFDIPVDLWVQGPAQVVRGEPYQGVIDTEMLQLDIAGTGPNPMTRLPVNLSLNEASSQYSGGKLKRGSGPGFFAAESFFDITYRIDLDGATCDGCVMRGWHGQYDPAPGATSALMWQGSQQTGKYAIELVSLSLTSVNPCTPDYRYPSP